MSVTVYHHLRFGCLFKFFFSFYAYVKTNLLSIVFIGILLQFHFSIFTFILKFSNYNNVLRVRYFLLKNKTKVQLKKVIFMYVLYVCTLLFKSWRWFTFLWKSLFCSINTAFIWLKIIKYYSIENNCFLCEYIVKCNLFLWCAAVFSASLLQSSESHDLQKQEHSVILEMVGT